MSERKPYIIVIEGLDGSGKETTKLTLEKLLKDKNYSVLTASFPMYERWHSFLVKWFLKGKFGKSPYSIPPKLACLFYTVDRFFGYHFYLKKFIELQEDLTGGFHFIIFDRYSTSNMLYQAARGKNYYDKLKIVDFINWIEHKLLKLPKPNKVFFLKNSAIESREAMKNREQLDILEQDLVYQKNVDSFSDVLIYYQNWFPIATRNYVEPYERYTPEQIAQTIFEHIEDWAKRF